MAGAHGSGITGGFESAHESDDGTEPPRHSPSRWSTSDKLSLAALSVSLITALAVIFQAYFMWSGATQSEATYKAEVDKDWNVAIRHTGGAKQELDGVFVTAFFDRPGHTEDFIKSRERPVPVQLIDSDAPEYRIPRIDEIVCNWTPPNKSCEENPLYRVEIRYVVDGRETRQILSPPS